MANLNPTNTNVLKLTAVVNTTKTLADLSLHLHI